MRSESINIVYTTSETIKRLDKAISGKLEIKNDGLTIITGGIVTEIKYNDLQECEYKIWISTGTYIHLKTKDQFLNIFTPSINIANWFIVNDNTKLKSVFDNIQSHLKVTRENP